MSLAFEQQPRESAKAFAAFSVYLNMGTQRSLEAVGQKLGKSKVLIERWSAKYDWSARTAAHGAHLAVLERQAVEVMAQAKAIGWAKRREAILETEWDLHEKAIAAAKKALTTFMAKENAYANLSDIARMLEVASKMGRLAAGMATDHTEVTGEVNVSVDLEFEAALKKAYGKPLPGEVVDVEVLADGHHDLKSKISDFKANGGNSQSQIADSQGGKHE
jgi:hypothetical protein